MLDFTAMASFQCSGNAAEGRIQVGSERLYGNDDCHRNSRRDQAVFDSRRAGLIFAKLREKLRHERPLVPLVVAGLKIAISAFRVRKSTSKDFN